MGKFETFSIEEAEFGYLGSGRDSIFSGLIRSFANSTNDGPRLRDFEDFEARRRQTREESAETMAKNRLQFDFTDEALQELDALKSATGAANRAEVIRRALQMLQWTVEQVRDEHGTVIVEKNGRQREVIFPFLTSAKGTANGR
jgi:hypothetical protein